MSRDLCAQFLDPWLVGGSSLAQGSLLVSQLQTSIGVIPSALLRQTDVVSVHFPIESADPNHQGA
eukprot:1180915-Prorocentrum_minimum.AAC.3